MSTIEMLKEAFPHKEGDWYYGPSYEQLAEKMVEEVVLYCSDNDYQGSSFALLRTGERYGYLEFGWGSCSGCDSLQACHSVEDVAELYDDLAGGIRWFDSLDLFLDWAKTHDWKGEWSWHDGAQSFIQELNAKYGTTIELPGDD